MRVITDREVYSYAPGDEKPKKEKKEKRSAKQWADDQKGKLDKVDDSLLFQTGASVLGQYLQNKYGPSQYNVTRDKEGNVSVGSIDGGNVSVVTETEQEKADREKKEKRKKTIIISSIIGGVIVIGIIAVVLYNRKK